MTSDASTRLMASRVGSVSLPAICAAAPSRVARASAVESIGARCAGDGVDIGAGEDDSERIIVAGGQVFFICDAGGLVFDFFFGGVVFAAVASLASAVAVWASALASAMRYLASRVAPVRGGTYFSLPPQRKVGKRKRLTPPILDVCPRAPNVPALHTAVPLASARRQRFE